jgi:hypothetical protein
MVSASEFLTYYWAIVKEQVFGQSERWSLSLSLP